MITAEKLTYSFPQKDLFHKISFSLKEGQHCALIGSSGAGKSTLIKILMDPENYMYDGKLSIAPDLKIGYISQFPDIDPLSNLTVFDYIATPFVSLQNRITSICTEMETAQDLTELLEEYQKVFDEFTSIDGDNYENNIIKKLNTANIKKDSLLHELSGGEFKLIQVIREMMNVPKLLIMDEPDVFLDFEHQNSLKDLINSYSGTIICITHNRYLLNHCFDKILHLENADLQEFDGRYMDYNFFLLQKKIEMLEQSFADEEEIKRNEDIVTRLRKDATIHTCSAKGRTLNARVSLLNRLKERKIKEPFVTIKKPLISFQTTNVNSTQPVLSVTNYSLAFDKTLLEQVTFDLGPNDKAALVGPNGSGKTTLLQDIMKQTSPSIVMNPEVVPVLISQNQDQNLTSDHTLLEEFDEYFDGNKTEIANYLLQYGFEETRLSQKLSALSGGEKNLIHLAKASLSNPDLLLLDEPTSHLDTYSQIALEEAIKSYPGAVLMISHDFYTIANCMDYVLLIENNTVRKLSIRKFRKMIYDSHFSKDYLEVEQKKQAVELKIAKALEKKDFELAKVFSEDLEQLISQM